MEKAEEAIDNGNYAGALEIYDQLISSFEETGDGPIPQGLLLGKANCFALGGHFRDSLENLLEAFQSSEVRPAQLHTFVKALVVEFTRVSTARREPGMKADVRLRCVSCSGIPVDPVTIPCGHTHCKACSEKMDLCGGCKERNSHGTASSCKVNVVLQGFLQKHFTQELKASHLRLLGNELFKKKDTEGALGKYQQALLICPSDHLVQGNISHVLCLHGKFDQSLERAESACQLRPEWAKGYYRKACALIGLGQKGNAVVAFAQCMARQMTENTNVRDALVKVLHELLCCVAQQTRIGDQEPTTGGPKEYEELLDLITGVQRGTGQEQNLSSGVPLLERFKANNHDVCTDSFECSLCCRLFYEPVTTPCGHTFCRTCLNRNLDHRPYCPICRFLLDQYLAERKQSITLAIDMTIQELFPVEYLERQQQHEHEMEQLASVALDTDVEIPVFVCAVAWPWVPCPLHVFEPRYRLMIRQCMESGSRQFGMCVPCNDENSFADYGVMLEIQAVQYLPDGRSYVDTVGGRRFKVLHRGMRDGYHTAKVVWIRDDPVPADEIESVAELHSRAHREAQQWFDSFPLCVKRRITPITGEMPTLERDPLTLPQGPAWVWWLAAICPISTDKQLSILATTSLKVRIQKLQEILASFPHF